MSEFETKIALLMEKETAYSADAYRFVAEAVDYTINKLAEHRHVSALELLKGAREFAEKEYGAVASAVLREFGLNHASDVGKVVYLLISAGLLSSSEDDSPEDFDIDFVPVPALEESDVRQGMLLNYTID